MRYKPELLKKKVDYFFSFEDSRRGRSAVIKCVNNIQEFGRTVVIGGMLRDFAFGGIKNFCSDIDLVIDPDDIELFDKYMECVGADRNRYGGYHFYAGKWKIDVWPLMRTWAKVEGHRKVDSLEDLVSVPFFNWDSILYDLTDKTLIYSDSYFDQINRKILDVNLEASLNPLGNAVRTLRAIYRYDAVLSSRLTNYVHEAIETYSDEEILLKEKEAHSWSCLTQDIISFLRKEIMVYVNEEQDELFSVNLSHQMRLPF